MSGTAAACPAGPTRAQVTQVRAFNRFYTNVIGVLHSMYLDTPYTLTESRLLFEIGRLVHGYLDPGPPQRARRRQPADAAADDRHTCHAPIFSRLRTCLNRARRLKSSPQVVPVTAADETRHPG